MRARPAIAGNRRIWLFITQCAWCRGIKVWRWYVRKPKPPLLVWQEQVRLPYLPSVVVSMTHGACPDCARRVNETARRSLARRKATASNPTPGSEDVHA